MNFETISMKLGLSLPMGQFYQCHSVPPVLSRSCIFDRLGEPQRLGTLGVGDALYRYDCDEGMFFLVGLIERASDGETNLVESRAVFISQQAIQDATESSDPDGVFLNWIYGSCPDRVPVLDLSIRACYGL